MNVVESGWRVKEAYPDLAGLTIWAIEGCYPGGAPPVFEIDAYQALELAEAIYQTIADEIRERLDAG